MPEFLNGYQLDIKDVYSIRNEEYVKKTEQKRKDHSVIFWSVFTLLTAVCLYVATDVGVFGALSDLKLLCIALFPAMSAVLFYRTNTVFYASAMVLPCIACAVRFLASGMTSQVFVPAILSGASALFCILSSCVFVVLTARQEKKTVYFVCQSVVCALVIAVSVMAIYAGMTGKADFISGLNKAYDSFGEQFRAEYMQLAEQTLNDKAFEEMLEASGISDDSKQALLNEMDKVVKNMLYSFKMLSPAVVAVISAVYALVSTAVFSLFARIFGIPVFVSIVEQKWHYRVSMITTGLYDVLFFVALIGSFFRLPEALYITVLNLLIILTPLLFVITVREIYSFFKDKKVPCVLSVLITAAITGFTVIVVSGWGFCVMISFGIILIKRRERLDKEKAADLIVSELNKKNKDSDDTGKTDKTEETEDTEDTGKAEDTEDTEDTEFADKTKINGQGPAQEGDESGEADSSNSEGR